MNIDHTIEKIIHLPRLFKSLGNKSINSLLRDTGYFEIADQVYEEDISKVLKRYPECINEWKLFSDNKRTPYGWYFKELENGEFIVGHFDPNTNENRGVEFSDGSEACALFIKHEIEDSRLI